MRKTNLLLLFLLLMVLTGCYNYDRGSEYGRFGGIQFFDQDGNEIIGEMIDYFSDQSLFEKDEIVALSNPMKPLNSPAPVEYYYCASVVAQSDVTVRMKIEPVNDYQFFSISINSVYYEEEDLLKVEEIEGFIYLDFLCTAVSNENKMFHIYDFKMKKEISGVTRYRSGSRNIVGRSYYSGFYFMFDE